MALSLLELILWVVRSCGFHQSHHVKLSHVRSPITVPFSCVNVPDVVSPGPGLRKLNISILEEAYVSLVEDFWSRWHDQKHRFPSLAKWWEAGKSRIKGLSVNYCCSKSSEVAVKRDLSRLATHLKERVDSGSLSLVGPYQSVLQQLATLDVEVAKGAQVRAQARWIEEGESSSSYFFRLEKKRGADRCRT